jgi:hypothetical protein
MRTKVRIGAGIEIRHTLSAKVDQNENREYEEEGREGKGNALVG